MECHNCHNTDAETLVKRGVIELKDGDYRKYYCKICRSFTRGELIKQFIPPVVTPVKPPVTTTVLTTVSEPAKTNSLINTIRGESQC